MTAPRAEMDLERSKRRLRDLMKGWPDVLLVSERTLRDLYAELDPSREWELAFDHYIAEMDRDFGDA
jgi:hypothetical protein